MIGVIADDLSGAAELGAMGLRFGLRAELILDGPLSGNADLVCVDTDSRSCSPEEAARRARSAARLLTRAGAKWIYKKTDSVLRGQVAAELKALLDELQLPLALLVPANPSLGRVIRHGQYFVGGKPLHETEFARDPQHPRASADIRELLRDAQPLPLTICNLRDPLPASGIAVAEVESPADLRAWATRLNPGILAAGAAEFFSTVLAGRENKPSFTTASHAATTPELFVCGTMSESSRRFIENSEKSGVPVLSLPPELATGADFPATSLTSLSRQIVSAFAKHLRVILRVGLPLVNHQKVAANLAIHLANVAGQVLESTNIAHVYAEGGGTAAALMRRISWHRLTVLQELAQGVATVAIENHPTLRFTLKPGSYLWPESIQKFSAYSKSRK